MNVFRKCLQKELGEDAYRHYIKVCEDELLESSQDSSQDSWNMQEQAVYKEMSVELRKKNRADIKKSGEHLMAAMYSAFEIGRRFTLVTIFYAIANVVMLMLNLDYTVTCVSVALMGACFIYKLVEFLSNKYCFIDAYLIMVYKSIIEEIMGKTLK